MNAETQKGFYLVGAGHISGGNRNMELVTRPPYGQDAGRKTQKRQQHCPFVAAGHIPGGTPNMEYMTRRR